VRRSARQFRIFERNLCRMADVGAGSGREDVTFSSNGGTCAAWLYRPSGDGPHPCVVMAHGFSGVRGARLDAYAERFAAAGLATLLFDYRYFGASSGEPRELLEVGRQLEDWRAAVAFARTGHGLDRDRIALFGTSFSGGHVVVIAARDPRISAVVSQCPLADGRATLLAVPPKNVVGLTVAGIRDLIGSRLGRGPYYLPAVGPPGTLAAMTAPEADPGFHAIAPPASGWRNRFSARAGLSVGFYRPITKARRVRCPVLVCVCDRDETTLADPAIRLAESLPLGEAEHYDCGHFDIYLGDWFERAVADQTDFLTRHLVGAKRSAAAVA
jgi:pimeloyl-ACP methyl ester carboxylesterase